MRARTGADKSCIHPPVCTYLLGRHLLALGGICGALLLGGVDALLYRRDVFLTKHVREGANEHMLYGSESASGYAQHPGQQAWPDTSQGCCSRSVQAETKCDRLKRHDTANPMLACSKHGKFSGHRPAQTLPEKTAIEGFGLARIYEAALNSSLACGRGDKWDKAQNQVFPQVCESWGGRTGYRSARHVSRGSYVSQIVESFSCIKCDAREHTR